METIGRMIKGALLVSLICGSLAGLAQAEIFWQDPFDVHDPNHWDTRVDGGGDPIGSYVINSLDNVQDGGDASIVGIEVTGGPAAIMYDQIHSDETSNIAYPGDGETRYLYFWGLYRGQLAGDIQYSVGFSVGDVWATEISEGLGFYINMDSEFIAARRNGSYGSSADLGGKANLDVRLKMEGGPASALTVTWQFKRVGENTWNELATLETTTAEADPRLIKIGVSTADKNLLVDEVEFSDEDRVRKFVQGLILPGPEGTLSFVQGVSGYMGCLDAGLDDRGDNAGYNYGASKTQVITGTDTAINAALLIEFNDIIGDIPYDPCEPNEFPRVPTAAKGVSIRQATLRLYHYHEGIGGTGKKIFAYPMLVEVPDYGDGDDDVATIGQVAFHARGVGTLEWGDPCDPCTWYKGPIADFDYDHGTALKGISELYGQVSGAGEYDPNNLVDIDVTAMVAAWHAGTLDNNGLLVLASTDQIASGFATSDNDASIRRPELIIEYGAGECGDVTFPYPAGDINQDCYVDMDDFGELSAAWQDCSMPGVGGCSEYVTPGQSEYLIPEGSAAVDGDLSEWTGADWISMDQVYAPTPADITSAQFAVRWNDATNRIYVAIKVDDTTHVFDDSWGSIPDDWKKNDRAEVYFSVNGGSFVDYHTRAQQYVLGHGPTADWAVLGGYRQGGPPPAVPADANFVYIVDTNGNEIQYEIGLTPFEYYDGLAQTGPNTVVLDLAHNETVLFDVVAITNYVSGYGAVAENTNGGKYNDTTAFTEYTLFDPDVCGYWGYPAADLNKNCYVLITKKGRDRAPIIHPSRPLKV